MTCSKEIPTLNEDASWLEVELPPVEVNLPDLEVVIQEWEWICRSRR